MATTTAMDFFEHQEAARKRSGMLVLYFILAVVGIIAAVYLVIAFAVAASEGQGRDRRGVGTQAESFDAGRLWDPALLGLVTLGTLAVVGGGTAYRVASLSGGGKSVAEILGGRPIDPGTADPDERRLLNVVEEMAIASGSPVPPVYLLENEEGINAFAAGYDPSDAVIGVTRGAVQTLSRDELQGVIAHEFSHILNGDMKLNIRLMGWLFGILLISIIGWIIFRSTIYSGRSRSSDGDKKGGNPLPLIGLALYVIGYIGVFFGRLIKAAVSRQREYLADASAVQFTRNPDGIAGALKKIGANAEGSRVKDAEAEEVSHMFFGEALGLSNFNPMATHPPLADRIRRIDPSFDGDFTKVSLAPPSHARAAVEAGSRAGRRGKKAGPIPFDPVGAITSIGRVEPQNLVYAASLLESIPAPLQEQAHEPFGAIALVYALLLDDDIEVRNAQLSGLSQSAAPPALQELQRVVPRLEGLDPEARLPLVELAIPALRRLSGAQFRAFVEDIRQLMEADRRISLFEYALRRMLMRHLGPQYGWGDRPKVRHTTERALVETTALILSALAHVGQTEPAAQQRAYRIGIEALGWTVQMPPLRPVEQTSLKAVDSALKDAADAAPMLKKQILTACAACIGADGRITLEEGELLRAVAESLDAPMPPLMAGSGVPPG